VYDVRKAHTIKKRISCKEQEVIQEVKKETGIEPQIWAARSIAQVFDKLKLPYDELRKHLHLPLLKTFYKNHPHPGSKELPRLEK